MVTAQGILYSIEELREVTGLATSTIYNLTQDGVVPPPRRGLLSHQPGKGLYSVTALEQLRKYLDLRAKGVSARKAKETLKLPEAA